MNYHAYIIEERQFEQSSLGRIESLFSFGNGHIGCRGFHIDRQVVQQPLLFMNGFYELTTIQYGETAFGYARFNQTMLSLPDIRTIKVYIDGEFAYPHEKCSTYRRSLDMKSGLFSYQWKFSTEKGVTAELTVETFFSLVEKNIGVVRCSIHTSEKVNVQILHVIDYFKEGIVDHEDPRKQTASIVPLHGSNYYIYQQGGNVNGMSGDFQTHLSALTLHIGCYDTYDTPLVESDSFYNEEGYPTLSYSFHTDNVTFTTTFYYASTKEAQHVISHETINEYQQSLKEKKYADLLKKNIEYYQEFWKSSDIEIGGDEQLQKALRFNIFQLHQSTGSDGKTSLSAKGLTGSGYEGHYFWDTEIYGMPNFILTKPLLARSLITYRINTLTLAKKRAREMSQKGALYPWRTINGNESSAYFPAGTAQYHINADIAYSILLYISITKDWSVVIDGAGEVLFETARFYYDLGFFNPTQDGEFCIHEVTGPDEYSALVDNNSYTNGMVKHHFLGAIEIYFYIKKHFSDFFGNLSERMQLDEQEIESWRLAANKMRMPFDYNLGINAQDERFLFRERWDSEKKGELKHPMLLYYHPLVIYRHQVIKQADTVLAMFLLSNEFPWYIRKRNFDYYKPLTTGDSSLSACVEGIVAFDCGYIEMGYEYLRQTILLDFLDSHGNTKDGLHTASMGGSWMAIVYGIAGFRFLDGIPRFRPTLPKSITHIKFSLIFNANRLDISLTRESTTYSCDREIELYHRSTPIHLKNNSITISTAPQIKAVIFDLDGVITSTDEYHFKAWKALCDEHGWKFSKELNQHLRGISREASLQVILDHNNIHYNRKIIESLTNKKNSMYVQSLEALSSANILPGIRELLTDLREHHIYTAIASASKNASFILEKLEIVHLFDYIVDAEDVIKGKPDPEVFVRAASALHLFPEECAAIEDSRAGISAITSGRMKSIGVGDAVDPVLCNIYVKSTSMLKMGDIIG